MLTDSEHTVNQPVSRCDEHIERKTLSQTHSKLPFCLPLLLGCYRNSALKGGLAVLFQVSQSTQPLFQGNNYSLSWLYNPKDVKTRPSNSMPWWVSLESRAKWGIISLHDEWLPAWLTTNAAPQPLNNNIKCDKTAGKKRRTMSDFPF